MQRVIAERVVFSKSCLCNHSLYSDCRESSVFSLVVSCGDCSSLSHFRVIAERVVFSKSGAGSLSTITPLSETKSRATLFTSVLSTPPAPINHVKIFKGWPPRDAPSKLVQLWYKSFPPDQRGQVEMKKPTRLSNKTSTA